MVSHSTVLAAAFGYLLVLFAIAAFADRRAAAGRSVIGNAWIYALSWAVYSSAWTYFGSIGRAAAGGVWFLPVYLGPMLAMLVAGIVVRKMIRIARTYRITSIADFIASRYGKSPLLAALVTVITVVGIIPYVALQIEAVSLGYHLLTAGDGAAHSAATWWQDSTLALTLALAAFTVVFGTRHLDSAERHEGMVAAIAFESIVKLVAFLAVGIFVTWGLYDGMSDIWARAEARPELAALARLDGAGGTSGFGHAQWFTMTMLSMFSVLLLPRQFQMMVVECVNERHLKRAAWVFPTYLLLINLFVLPLAIGGELFFGPGKANAETFIVSLPLAAGQVPLALFAYIGGLSAATGMLIVETVAISTMVCNHLVLPALLGLPAFGARRRGDLTRLLLNIRRAAIVMVLLLGYLYFQIAGEDYGLVSIGLISFAAVAQFAPALFGGMYWPGGTRAGAVAGLAGGFVVWAYTLMLPSVARSGWIPAGFVEHGPFGIGWLAPEHLFGMTGLDSLSHGFFWSLLVNGALYVGLSLRAAPSVREASQALLFVDVFRRERASRPVLWRGRARIEDLRGLAARLLGDERARALFAEHEREVGSLVPDARLVDRVERHLAGAVGSALAHAMVASVVQEETLGIDEVIEILDEASQVRSYARALETASAELRAANEKLLSLDQLKDDFISSVTHELRTPLTSIRALSELMLDTPGMEPAQREEFLEIIVAESERLSRLVNQVLDLARIEAGLADWHPAEVDMNHLVADAVRATSELFRARGAVVDLHAEEVPPITADPDRLTQVMLNLLSNAAKFMPESGGRVEVRLGADAEALTVEVCDNGPGVPEDERAAVFEKFRQSGDSATRPPGTGLGLPISRQIVDHFGGRMWVKSAPQGGACFGFRLPLPGGEG